MPLEKRAVASLRSISRSTFIEHTTQGSERATMERVPESFNQSRMERCSTIQRSIMDNWQKTNSFFYIVRATDSVEGCTLDELRKQYFAIGISEDTLQEIPFTDLLVIFYMISQECAELEKRKGSKDKEFSVSFQVTTDYSDDDALQILSGITIQTPFDTGETLRIRKV